MSNVNVNGNVVEKKGIVKKVLSGDTVIIRGTPRGGPPPEASVSLAYISAPKIARKVQSKDGEEAKIINDEPYAWEAREYLRKLLIGKEVTFRTEYTIPSNNPNAKARECGILLLENENIAEKLVAEGLAKVIRRKQNESNDNYLHLIQLEDEANTKTKPESMKRVVKFDVEETSQLERKKFRGIVEDVIDGSTLRVGLLMDSVYQYVVIMLAGIKCPQLNDKIGAEAKFYTECRLLNKEVEVHLEQPSSESQKNKFYGSVVVDGRNIAEFLLKEGMARLMSNSLNSSINPTALRAAEKEAKTKRLRLFKDFTEAKQAEADSVEVVEVINGDALKVKNSKGVVRKIFLSSIRPPPKPEGFNEKSKQLYDIPLMFEAREFLRKRLIGKNVQVTTDYKQPARSVDAGKDLAEKECCTVVVNGNINVAEALVSKGLATVVKHRENDPRSSQYDALLDAEAKAQKTKRGVHASTPASPYRIVDLSNDVQKARHHLSFLQRGTSNSRLPATVEYVYSSSRVKVYVPKENCLLNLILQGINSPRAGEPFSNEGLDFVRSMIHQRDIEITVESMDKLGNFIGQVHFENKNLSLELIKQGYASVRDSKQNQLVSAEEEAKRKKLNIWQNYVESEVKNEEEEPETNGNETTEEKRVEVMVTNVSPDMSTIFVQKVENETRLEELLTELREELAASPPLPGSYQIKKAEICAAKFSADKQWYRAKVEKILKNNCAEVLFIDYGNREEVSVSDLAPLPSSKYAVSDLAAKEYGLALVSLPSSDLDAIHDARVAFQEDICDKALLLKSEYKDTSTGLEYVTLLHDKRDVVRDLISEGMFLVNWRGRRERRLQKLVSAYKEAQETARRKRMNIWRYGDFTEDDANEFGLGK